MANKNIDITQIICIAIGVMVGMVVFRGLLGFSPIVGGALGGGTGAFLGIVLAALVRRIRS